MNDQPNTIERANTDDAAEVKQCVTAAYQHYIERIGKWPGPMLDDYDVRIQENEVYVIREHRQIIGVLVLILSAARFLLDNIAVLPDRQGRGYGRHLMEFAEYRAREKGYTSIELYTHEAMVENITMYKKWDYLEIYRTTEQGYERIYMRKKII